MCVFLIQEMSFKDVFLLLTPADICSAEHNRFCNFGRGLYSVNNILLYPLFR